MRLILTFARSHPWPSLVMLVALLLAGAAEGIGLTTLLPLLSTVIETQTAEGLSPNQNHSDTEPQISRFTKDLLTDFGIEPSIGAMLIIIVASIVIKNLLMLLARKQIGYTVAQFATDLRVSLLRALITARWEYFLRKPVGSLSNAMATETVRASEAFLFATEVVSYLMQILVYSTVAFLVSWKATLVALLTGGIVLYSLRHFIHQTKVAGAEQTRIWKEFLSRLTDCFQAVKPLKAMGCETLIGPVLESSNHDLNQALRKGVSSGQTLQAFQEPLLTILIASGLYGALSYLGLPLATVLVLALIMVRVMGYLGRAQRQYQRMLNFESAFWSLKKAIREAETEKELDRGKKKPLLEKGIHVDHVSFAYKKKAVLRDVSLTLPVGSFSTLIGPSGSGKTTLADVVSGLLIPQTGEVWIDDLPLGKLDMNLWRRMIGYVPQENLLLNESVLVNVTLGDQELSASQAEKALRDAEAWDFVSEMPQGMHSVVGERGAMLSGGQRQRIAIARALVRHPKFLILDEITSALDPESEIAVCHTLQKLRGHITILAISHRSSLVDIADQVLRVSDGLVVKEKGKPTSLDELNIVAPEQSGKAR